MLPDFPFRAWYTKELSTIEQVVEKLMPDKPSGYYYRGMSDSGFICISSYYRHYVWNKKGLEWHDVVIDAARKQSFPNIDEVDYVEKSFLIINRFKEELKKLGSISLPTNTLIYLAQHYGLPTNVIDFTLNAKIALYFACEENLDKDCVVYESNIHEHIQRLLDIYLSGGAGYTRMTNEELAQSIVDMKTTISPTGLNLVTPIIEVDNVKYNRRIQHQEGVFVYNADILPYDLSMFNISEMTYHPGRNVYKIPASLKTQILDLLDSRYGINEGFIYPDNSIDINLDAINEAVENTKDYIHEIFE
ncbi:FRG domain-containing protein [Thalassotalea ponticola]|uniref:FRG domain-containing protein n=1 Tax=Thalassotalea ponticola TaxID=1523392 RepID=UPI0025B5CCDC|nr:FRG domain-containing protein [Thalassotalea ponticola]MDN3651264.1 FRG domain-containing protein [Thalassotalea ponticola]